MVFSSLPFLYLFLTAVLLLHAIVPARARNILLLAANLLFYAYGEPRYLLLMIASIAVNFCSALLMERLKQGRKLLLIANVVINLGALGWFKYAGLLTATLQKIPSFGWMPLVEIALPVGISFFTFQAMSYVVDVYRKDCAATGSILEFAAYISLFPQLIAGPIVRYCDVAEQLHHRSVTVEKFSWGVRMFSIGLAKKVLLANSFALLWQQVSADPGAAGTLAAWAGIAAYTLQIYFDFSGYSDMARGLGSMLGFDFCNNFDYPYISASVSEFWRRWHISLSTWFRDYVYIPLGGSRKGTGRTICNLLIVWMLTGFWHGADWNFLLWGLYYGLLLILEKFVFGRLLSKLPKCFCRIYTIVLVMVGWVLFATEGMAEAGKYLTVMFTGSSASGVSLLGWVPLGVIGILAALPLGKRLWRTVEGKPAAAWLEMLLCLCSLILSTASLVSGSYNPFLYFRF